MKHKVCFTLIVLFIAKIVLGQSCFVAVDSAKGIYTGECKNGKANGKGKYQWQNGDIYEGSWKNGWFDGFGILRRKTQPDSNKVISGFWKQGIYTGKYEKPYIIEVLTNNISELTLSKSNNEISQINITVKNNSGGSSNMDYAVIPKTILSNIQLLGGRYEELQVDTLSRIASRYTLRRVTFPFTALLTFETRGSLVPVQMARIEIFETGNWILKTSLDN